MLVTIFNDKNEDNSYSLQHAIHTIPGIETLKYPPTVRNSEVGKEIVAIFSPMRLVPTLFFVDPWGYKGLTLQLINSVLKDWGCDAIIFFNYNRIRMGLSNLAVEEHMNALFTEKRAASLRARFARLSPSAGELAIVEEIANALTELGAKYVLPFCFKNAYGTRTSHHLIFATKNFRGYDIMKGIMGRQSSAADQGVPSCISISLSDLFLEDVPFAFIERVFNVMQRASWHQFQVLTKRSERLIEFACKLPWPQHVWMGVSVENEDYSYRIDHLRQTPANIKFLSLEPLLGPLPSLNLENIHWVIVGGESGPGARPIEAFWVIDIRNQCCAAGVPFFFKQWGGVNKKRTGREIEGRTWDEMPLPLTHNGRFQGTLLDV